MINAIISRLLVLCLVCTASTLCAQTIKTLREANLALVQADSLYQLGFSKEALPVAKAIQNYSGKNRDTLYANALALEAWCLYDLSKNQEAEKKGNEAYRLRSGLRGSNHPDVADSYYFLGNFCRLRYQIDSALAYYEKGLKIFQEIDPGSAACAYGYRVTGLAYLSMGEFDKQEEFQNKSMKILRDLYGENHPLFARSISMMNIYNRHPDTLEHYFDRAIDILENRPGPLHPWLSQAYEDLANFESARGNEVSAIQNAEKALELAKSYYGPLHSQVSDMKRALSNFNYYRFGKGEAERWMWEAFRDDSLIYGAGSPRYLSNYSDLGDFYLREGENERAEAYYQKYTDGMNRAGKTGRYLLGLSCVVRGATYAEQNKFGQADEFFRKAISIFEDPAMVLPKVILAEEYAIIGFNYCSLGKMELAKLYIEKSEDMLDMAIREGTKSSKVPFIFIEQGFYYGNCEGDLKKIKEKIWRGMETGEKLGYGSSQVMISACNVMQMVYSYYEPNPDSAEIYAKKSNQMALRQFEPLTPGRARSYGILAGYYFQQKKFGESRKYYEEQLRNYRGYWIGSHPDVASAQFDVANTISTEGIFQFQRTQDTSYAVSKLDEALDTLQQALLTLHYPSKTLELDKNGSIILLKALYSISNIYAIRNNFLGEIQDLRLAKQYIQSACEIVDNTPGFLLDKDVSLLMVGFGYQLGIHVNKLLGKTEKYDECVHAAFRLAEQAKSPRLQQALRERRAKLEAGLLLSAKLEAALLKEIDSIAFLLKLSANDAGMAGEAANWRQDLIGKYEAFDRLIRELETSPDEAKRRYAQTKYDNTPPTIASLQADMSNDQTLVEYAPGFGGGMVAFVINKESYKMVDLGLIKDACSENIKKLLDATTGYYSSPADGMDYAQSIYQYNEAARALYKMLVDSLSKDLKKHVVIIRSDELSRVPFEMLLTEDPPFADNINIENPYLLHRHFISYCYSAGLLKEMQGTNITDVARQGIGIFRPEYDPSDEFTAQVKGGDKNLKGSSEEAQRIKAIFPFAVLFDGEDGTLKNFLEHCYKFGILHITGHAQSNNITGDSSYVIFYRDAGHTKGSNLLYAQDIYRLRLKANLVTLSNCLGADGENERMEGLISLTRAFSYAGAKSVLAAVWSVEDESTKQLMEQFYQNLNNGLPKDEALTNAKIQLITDGDFQHPYFWGAFILTGDAGPFRLK